MPSFDTVLKADAVELRNAVEQTNKEITGRFDFKGSSAKVELKEFDITIHADSEFQREQVLDVLRNKCTKRNVDPKFLVEEKVEKMSGDKVKHTNPSKDHCGIPKPKTKGSLAPHIPVAINMSGHN